MRTDELAEVERGRLRALVEGRGDELDALHAEDFRLVTPSGHVWSKEGYVGGIASGEIDYRRFEALSEIEVMVDKDVAVLRYRSAIEISENGEEPGKLEAWHLDAYRRNANGDWQIQWSQATAIR